MLIIAAFFITGLARSTAQDSIYIACTEDSVFYKRFIAHMDTFVLVNHSFDKIKEQFLNKEQNCFCSLLIYAKLFDFLLNNKLDLEYSVLKDPPISMSGVMSIDGNDIETRKQRSESIKKHKYFSVYIYLKKAFEEDVIKKYELDKNLSLEQDVNNILRYGIYAYPSSLKGILLTKNADALIAKYRKEKAMLWDEN
jgi:hypothetical protein